MKRDDYLSWDEYFMGIALLSAQRSKDSNTQVGACIVNQEHKIVSVGYNGMPTGCNDDDMPWEREGDFHNTKYPFVCHAELNAILFPCNECAKAIIQSGIREIIYYDNKYADTDATKASQRMFLLTGVTCRPYHHTEREMALRF